MALSWNEIDAVAISARLVRPRHDKPSLDTAGLEKSGVGLGDWSGCHGILERPARVYATFACYCGESVI